LFLSVGAQSRRCEPLDPGDPALPVAGTGSLAHVRKSKNSKWRALALLAVHVLIAGHATHFLIAGRTLSPVEPSEAMYTFELGQVNAGFVFLVAALAVTLVFGRFVCGWGCHIVALQDLCGWVMKRVGVRPRPFRSRLLIWVPLVVGLYMFVWPTVSRVVLDRSAAFPGFTNHLVTDSFWKTFPGPVFAILTFACCGFAAVYFLGSKGFCTYGCPYGGLFGVVDRLSPGRIVADDSCEQCGHCTVTCTSNVLVHDEVHRYGQVVDPGCMKCLDCVSVCPKGALSFSFGTPSLFKRARDRPRARRYSLSLAEELTTGAICLGATLAFRGLYDGPPLLMSVGLGSITAFLALKLWRLGRRSDLRLQNLRLKTAGRLQPAGWLLAGLTALWLAFTAHSAFVQGHRFAGRYWLNRTEAHRDEVLSGAFRNRAYSPAHDRAATRSFRHFSLADSWGLAGVVEVKVGLAWSNLLQGRTEAAEEALRDAITLAPTRPRLHEHLIDLLLGQGRAAETIDALQRKLASVEPAPEDHFRLAGMLVVVGRGSEAVEHYARTVDMEPGVFEARYNFGGLLRRLDRHKEAIEHLESAGRLAPGDADTRVELGLAYMALGENAAALAHLRRAVELDPDSPESRLHLPNLIRQLESSLGRP
jgi:polyferredoxin/Tfp pilus assembly protein PilF